MTSGRKSAKPPPPGKSDAPASEARVERRKKPAAAKGASVPKTAKASKGTGGKGGGLH